MATETRNRQCNSNRRRMVDEGFEWLERQSLQNRKPAGTPADDGRLEKVMGRYPTRNQYQSPGLLGLSYIQTEFKRKRIDSCVTNFKEFITKVKNKTIQVLTDSVTTCAFINFQGG